jgi:N-acetyl-anhydromuramyl-L-alanine amidase AmpD
MTVIDKLLPPNCYSGNALVRPQGIVIHYFSCRYADPPNWDDPQACYDLFKALKLSAHFLVARDGTVYRLVPENHQAWHAGESAWAGRSGLNTWTYGIEFIATRDSGFTDAQYASGQLLVAQLMSKYHIPLFSVVGHNQVAPGRKIDPGPLFDWDRFKAPLGDIV